MKKRTAFNPSAQGISRRSLLRGAAALGVMGAASTMAVGCSPKETGGSSSDHADLGSIKWDEETDVVVVGAGGAGSMAALETKKAGAEVIVFESNGTAGGSTSLSSQAICGGGTWLQEKLGVEDTPEAFYEYLCSAGDGDEAMWRIYADNAPALIDWLTEIGVTFPEDLGHTPGLEYGGQENQAPELPLVRRVHWSDKEKGGIWSFVWNEVQKADIDVRLKTPVERLLFDPGTREVKGVVADGKNIKARKGVVLCGGGFPTNAEMMRENISKFPILAQGSPECDGSAIRMAIDAGAACMGWGWGATAGYLNGSIEEGKGQAASAFIQLTHNSAPHSEIPYIVVDSFGKRLISELDIVNIASAILSKTANGVAYQITNDIGALDLNWGQVGEVKYETADTVEELAEKLGINPEGLRKTVESWDGYIANGEDPEFGRTNLYPFGNGPFAGVEMYPCVLDTYGGPLTDAEMRVLKAIDHEPIPRLYRGGVLGFRTYPLCGAAVGMALCTGMIAGRNVAALENWQ